MLRHLLTSFILTLKDRLPDEFNMLILRNFGVKICTLEFVLKWFHEEFLAKETSTPLNKKVNERNSRRKKITRLDFFIRKFVVVALINLKNMSFIINLVTLPLSVKPSQTLMQA